MPIVYIWYPDKDHPYGHAALQTDKYYISFWPDGDVKRLGVTKAAYQGVPGSINFHPELDRHYEKQLPTGVHKICNATDDAINRVYEEFLEYNVIDPNNVTIEAAEKLVDNLVDNPVKNHVGKLALPEKSVAKTLYSYNAYIKRQSSALDLLPPLLLTKKNLDIPNNSPFYYHKQSCVSFCFNIIENADPNPQGMTSILFDLVTLQTVDSFSVPWLESHIKKHWMKDNIRNSVDARLNALLDNSITRSARYVFWDFWNSNSQTTGQQVEGFRKYPVDFTKAIVEKVSNKNKY